MWCVSGIKTNWASASGTDETGAKVVGRRVKRELEKTSGVRVGITYEVLKAAVNGRSWGPERAF